MLPGPSTEDCLGKQVILTKGSDADEKLTGTGGDDGIVGAGGADDIGGLEGNDCLFGQAGTDSVDGGPGDDSVQGNRDEDNVQGGDGDDDVRGQNGNDKVSGGADNDTVTSGAGDDTATGGSGDDSVKTNGGDDTIDPGSGEDSVNAGGGADDIDAVDGDNDVIDLRHGQGRRPRRPDRRGRRQLQHRRRHRLSTATYCADARGDDARRDSARQGSRSGRTTASSRSSTTSWSPRASTPTRSLDRRAREIAATLTGLEGERVAARLSRPASIHRGAVWLSVRGRDPGPLSATRSRSQVRGPADPDDHRRLVAAGDPEPGRAARFHQGGVRRGGDRRPAAPRRDRRGAEPTRRSGRGAIRRHRGPAVHVGVDEVPRGVDGQPRQRPRQLRVHWPRDGPRDGRRRA